MNIRQAKPVSTALWPQSARRNWCFLCKSRMRFIICVPLPFEAKLLRTATRSTSAICANRACYCQVDRLKAQGVAWKPSGLPASTRLKRSVRCGHRGSSKIDVEPRAPDRHGLVLAQVRSAGHVVVLITNVTFNGSEVQEPGFLYSGIIFGIGSRYKIDVDVRTIRCLEIRQPQHSLSFNIVNTSSPHGFV